jgi:pyruvate formate lyase activating enzyme
MVPAVHAPGRPAKPTTRSAQWSTGEAEEGRARSVGGPASRADDGEPSVLAGPVREWGLATGDHGPGTRLVLFTAGCPLRCLYCSGPRSWDEQGGRRVTVAEVMRHVRRYAPLFELTGGGVTVSGGEPLMHPAFVAEVLKACRAEGIRTVLDTSGVLGADLADATLGDIDLTLLDLKAYDAGTYFRVTGGDVAPSLAFARRLAAAGRPIVVRFVLVPGLTDSRRDVEELAAFVAGLGTVEWVDVVPFHRGGQADWAAMGLRFPLADRPGPTRQAMADVREAFSRRGLTVG